MPWKNQGGQKKSTLAEIFLTANLRNKIMTKPRKDCDPKTKLKNSPKLTVEEIEKILKSVDPKKFKDEYLVTFEEVETVMLQPQPFISQYPALLKQMNEEIIDSMMLPQEVLDKNTGVAHTSLH